MDLLTNLGIDWRLFIAQSINFIILLVLLRKFLYKPLISMLDKREARLQKGLDLTDAMEVKTKKMAEEHAQVIREARSEAERIIGTALSQTDASRLELLESARTESKRILEEGKTILVEQQRVLIETAKKEVATLVVEATRKVIAELEGTAPDSEKLSEAVTRLGRA